MVPLHRSAEWFDVVVGNVERLAPVASVVLSDATGEDDTLERLRRTFSGLDRVTFLGPRAVESGWVAHSNDLAARAVTPYAMWLPHDDEIDASWITESEEVLDARPEVVATLGDVTGIYEPGGKPSYWTHVLEPGFTSTIDVDRCVSAVRTAVMGDASNLGALFRVVFRTNSVPLLPRSLERDEWADVLWAVRLLTLGPISRLPSARYRKRFYAGNTHGTWRDIRSVQTFRSRDILDALAGLRPAEALRVVAEVWSEETLALSGHGGPVHAHSTGVDVELERTREWVEELTATLASAVDNAQSLSAELERAAEAHHDELMKLRHAYESSTSWRLTRPLRGLRRSQ
jgi:hypothetical protein